MTREEAMIHTLVKENDELKTEIGRLKQALEKEPCKDAVSRSEVNKLCNRYLKVATDDHVAFYEDFCNLQSVTPTRKKGKWIEIKNKNGTVIALRCNCCEKSPKHAIRSFWCPNCGAEMRGGEDGSN